jgi:hypothetical protein
MRKSGYADLPLHSGHVPAWLYQRMSRLGGAIVEAIVLEYGKKEVLRRLSDPCWFQSLGAVLGMDWHSSGITTSVLGALKSAVNPISRDLGIYFCGGRGKHSLKTPQELLQVADRTGLNGAKLVENSRLSAKIDNTAIQDGFQLYLHSFILTDEGDWAVVQQGMNNSNGMARRYHWHSESLSAFLDNPHTGVTGINQGLILNLAASEANGTREGILKISREKPISIISEVKKLVMPRHHHVSVRDVDLKRLGSVLATAQENDCSKFEELLLTPGLGPRTLQSLTLVSEVIHGTPSRFSDPARYSFAHGGKDGHPFPVPLKVYDQSINVLRNAVEKAKIPHTEKSEALKKLHHQARVMEEKFIADETQFEKYLEKERSESYKFGGKTVFGDAKPIQGKQLSLF